MSQQFHGGQHDGSRTLSIRDTYDYAIVNRPGEGKWKKTASQAAKRHEANIKKRMKILSKPSSTL